MTLFPDSPPDPAAAGAAPDPAARLAELGGTVAELGDGLDLLWLIGATALVALMQAGFLCLEAGLTRAKDSINVAVKNTADFAVSVVLFWLVGYGAMYGLSAGGWVGTGDFAPALETPRGAAFFTFQAVFCGATATIVSGACAGRTRFPIYLAVAAGLGTAVYPLVGHWVWNAGEHGGAPGWLAALGFVDFAGSTVVHSVGGWAALATVLAVGPRRGRFAPVLNGMTGAGHAPRASNPTLAHLGALLLMVGWFGFNVGSTLGADAAAGKIAANTLLGACAGTLGAAVTALLRDRRRAAAAGRRHATVDAVELLNGLLGGLVAVTAGCAVFTPAGALAAGLLAGPAVVLGAGLLARWRVDDAVGAVPVHAFCGAWGTLAVALLAPAAAVEASGLTRWGWLGVQALGVVACGAFTLGTILPALRLLRRLTPLRVTAAAEAAGLNVSEHGAKTDLWELVEAMEPHRRGDFSRPAPVEPCSEAAPVAQQYNRVVRAFGASRDRADAAATDAHAAAGRARAAAARTGAILAGATEAIVAADAAGRILEFNPAAERAFGRRRRAALGRNLAVLFPPDQHARLQAALRPVMRDGRAVGHHPVGHHPGGPPRRRGAAVCVETVAVRADGRTFPAEVSANRSFLPEAGDGDAGPGRGGAAVLTLFIADVSARREAERQRGEAEERRRAQLAAETADKAKSQFLAHMSHEIRTPLNAMVGFVDLLLDGEDEDPVARREHLDAIRRSGEHLTELIGDVLDLSRIESGKAEVRRGRCEPHAVLAGVVSMLRVRAAEKGVTLDFHWDGPVPDAVWTDAGRLRQIVLNLVGNALKFTARGGVRLTASVVMPPAGAGPAAPAALRVAAADTGSGVSAADLGRIFQPFEQTEEGARGHGGTGLGLAISREFATLLGGSLTATSELGRGSTFTLEIDAGPADRLTLTDQPPDQPAAGDLARPAGGHLTGGRPAGRPAGGRGPLPKLPACRVLVADDGEANRKLLDRALRRAGAAVVCVADGRAAVDAVFPPGDGPGGGLDDGAEPFDAVLMDVQMPVLGGLAATRELRRRGFAAPVFAVTAQAMAGDDDRCRRAGCTAHLAKPVDLHALLAALRDRLPAAGPAGAECSAAPDDLPPPDFDPEFADLREDYRTDLRADAARLTAAHAASDRAEVGRLAHKIAGSAGTFGFPRSAAAAARLERAAAADAAAGEAAAGTDDLAPLLDALTAALPPPAAAVPV